MICATKEGGDINVFSGLRKSRYCERVTNLNSFEDVEKGVALDEKPLLGKGGF